MAVRGVACLLLVLIVVIETYVGGVSDDVELSSSGKCPLQNIQLDISNVIANLNVTLKGLENLLGPLADKDGVYVASLERPTAQNHLVGLLMKKMEEENNQLRERISQLEVEKARISDRVAEWNKEYTNEGDDQKQKSHIPCFSLQWPRDCQDLYHQGKNVSGVYTIYPQKCGFVGKGVRVWCEFEAGEGGWTTILRRRKLEHQVDFNRGWRYYRLGFGDPDTEHWLGNDYLHKMTSERTQMLRVDMMDWDGNTAYAEYNYFHVDNADGLFRLHVGGYSGTAGDSLNERHNLMPFSTPDRENDVHETVNCASEAKGGFWYKNCAYAGPTHPIMPSKVEWKGLSWYHWYGKYQTLQAMTFKIKPVTCLVG